MKKTKYVCDACEQVLFVEDGAKHISMTLGHKSGWFGKNTDTKEWEKKGTAIKGSKQFCDAVCLSNYFNSLIKE